MWSRFVLLVFRIQMVFYIVAVLIRLELLLSFRLTDPIPATETSIAPRQRPKAGQAQPITGILPIQPALTPRKRANAPAGPCQPISECSLFTFIQNQTLSRHPHMCGFSLSCSLSLFTSPEDPSCVALTGMSLWLNTQL